MTTTELAGELLTRLDKDNTTWKQSWLKDVCKLCVEYIALDGLADAMRSVQIPDEILDIAEKQL